MILVIGTKDSGKSVYAEGLVTAVNGVDNSGKGIAYIATMEVLDEEAEGRIIKHRKQREGKGFITFEEPLCVSHLADEFLKNDIDTALLECVSNLAGNVMHSQEYLDKTEDEIISAIASDVLSLDEKINNLVVVANDFENMEEYDEETQKYIRINNGVNQILKEKASKYAIKVKGGFELYDNN